MLYGVVSEKLGLKGKHEKEKEQFFELRQAIEDANNMGLSTVNVDGLGQRHSYVMPFSAVHIIVPTAQREAALLAAQEAGASGVTITDAHGMGLEAVENFYNRLEQDATDVDLMFLVPTKMADGIIKNVMEKLDIVGQGDGIAFAYPVSHLKGVSLKREHL